MWRKYWQLHSEKAPAESSGPWVKISMDSIEQGPDAPSGSSLSIPAARLAPQDADIVRTTSRFSAPDPEIRKRVLKEVGGDVRKMQDRITNALIQKYKQTGDEEPLNNLYGMYQSALDNHIAQAAYGRLPEPAVRTAALASFKDAIDDFEPNKGKRFYNYFVDNKFRSVINKFRPYSSFRKTPNSRAFKLDAVGKVRDDLELTLGRDPTAKEIGGAYVKTYGKTLNESELNRMLQEVASEHLGSEQLDNSYLKDSAHQFFIAATRAKDTLPRSDYKLFDAMFLQPLEKGESLSQRKIAKDFGLSTSSASRKHQAFRDRIMDEYNVLTR